MSKTQRSARKRNENGTAPARALNLRDIEDRTIGEPKGIDPSWPELFAKNLDELRRWFRNSSTPGREMGHIVLSEMLVGYTIACLTHALEGKSWAPPSHAP